MQRGAEKVTKATKNLGQSIKNTHGQIMTASNVMRGVFASAIVYAGIRMIKLAAQAEAVEIAFKRLNQPGLLRELQDATRNTVSNFELMKAAVRAENFAIPLKNLSSLMAFAQQRARDTGESVDYLVDSIVMGIGRKSPMILDNLGISIIEVREEFKKTGDMAQAVANIADRNMIKLGKTAETTADKIAQSEAAFKNLSIAIGNILASDVVTENLQMLAKIINGLAGANTQKATSDIEGLQAVIGKHEAKLADLINRQAIQIEYQKQGLANTENEVAGYQKLIDKEIKHIAHFTKMLNKKKEDVAATKESISEYSKWVVKKETARLKTEQETEWMIQYNRELMISLGLWRQMPDNPFGNMSGSVKPMKRELQRGTVEGIKDGLAQIPPYAMETGAQIAESYAGVSSVIGSTLTNSFTAAFTAGENAAEAFFKSLEQTMLSLAARALVGSFLSVLPGFNFLSFMGFQSNAQGGIIPEPVVGFGINSGKGYTFAEEGPERVLSAGETAAGMSGITINFNGNITDKRYVNDFIMPEIKRAVQLGRA